MAAWTHYWRKDTVAREREAVDAGERSDLLDHAASNAFRRRGVTAGDDLYVISFSDGELYVIGHMLIDRVVGHDEARRALDYKPWAADDHALARRSGATRFHFDAVVPEDRMKDVAFVAPDGTVGVARDHRGNPDPQTFRGVREVTPSTARLFDGLLNGAG
jgi:hypothetical protein